MLEYPFRSASHQQMIHRAVAVCAHHNEVRINGVLDPKFRLLLRRSARAM